MMKRIIATTALLGICACAPPEEPKITEVECEKLAQRMVTYTVMEKAKNAAEQEEMKKELMPKYLESCKAELPTQRAYKCAMAAPDVPSMQQCR
jgi:hypothetical protein